MTDERTRLRHELASLMAQIDALDEDLVALLVQRFQRSRRIGAIKRELAMPKSDPARIAAQIGRFRQMGVAAKLDEALLGALMGAILDRVVAERDEVGPAAGTDPSIA